MTHKLWVSLHRRPVLVAIVLMLSLVIIGVGGVFAVTNLPPAKQAIEDHYAQIRAYGEAHKASKDPNKAPTPPVSQDSPRQTGIIENSQAPFSSQDVQVENQWQRKVNGAWVQVYAGALTNDPTQGFVQVLTESPAGNVSGKQFRTGIKAGAVRITAEHNLQFTLVSKNGASFTFDLPAATLVSKAP